MNRLNPTSQSLNITSNLSAELTCFTWNEDHYCFLGSSIFAIRDGKAEHFLSGLPVEDNNHIRVMFYFPFVSSMSVLFNFGLIFFL